MVELIPKEAPKIPKWLNILFYFSLALLLLSIASFFVLGNFINKNQNTLAELRETLLRERTPERIALEREILNYEKKISDFANLAGEHLESSKIFTVLEDSTHPRVWFSQFNLNSNQGIVNLVGVAQSFESLGQQILILKDESSIQEVNLEEVSIDKTGRIDFALSLILQPNTLR